MKDLVGEPIEWPWDDLRAHVVDDLAIGAFPMIVEDQPDELVHTLPEHPFCDDPSCPCHEDEELITECLTQPWVEGQITNDEANRIYRGETIRR